jgi:hypothetical protein
MAQIKLVTVKANGRRYMYLNAEKGKVHVRGEVLAVGGYSSNHGAPKTFMIDRVDIKTVDLSTELLAELLAQGKRDPITDKPIPEPAPKVKKERKKKHPLANFNGQYWEFTPKAIKQLKAEGEDMAWDGLGNYLSEDLLQDAAMDVAQYHMDFTDAGMREGYNPGREAIADYIYDGMLKGLERVKAEGRSTDMPVG